MEWVRPGGGMGWVMEWGGVMRDAMAAKFREASLDGPTASERYRITWTLQGHVDATGSRGRYRVTWTLQGHVDTTGSRGCYWVTWTLQSHVRR